jgi:hypothetical protein
LTTENTENTEKQEPEQWILDPATPTGASVLSVFSVVNSFCPAFAGMSGFEGGEVG